MKTSEFRELVSEYEVDWSSEFCNVIDTILTKKGFRSISLIAEQFKKLLRSDEEKANFSIILNAKLKSRYYKKFVEEWSVWMI